MATYDNFHSQLVGWSKILLPLAALALLSTLFLFARSSSDGDEIPFAEIDELAREQRITAPEFSGVAGEGSLIQITASTAKPIGDDKLTVARPRLLMNAADGTSLQIFAGAGEIDNATQYAELTGLARLETSSGYLMETSGLAADMKSGVITSLGPLEIQAPYGELTAGAVEVSVPPQGDLGQQMHFTQGVKLVYRPSSGRQ